MPLGADVGENIKELRKTHPEWSEERIRAAALNAAREAGGHVAPLKKDGMPHGRVG